MRNARYQRARRNLARIVLACTVLLAIAAAAACPYAGHYLIIEEQLEPADAIVVLAGPRTVRWLEGVELYREGLAPNIILSPGIVEQAEVELRARGIHFPSEADLVKDAMVQLGIPSPAITVIGYSVDNTADEAASAKPIVMEKGWTRLIVVTSKYHTRRTKYAFEREFQGTPVRVQVKGSRYDGASPDGWWRSRSDLRYVVSELQKLAAYRLGLRN